MNNIFDFQTETKAEPKEKKPKLEIYTPEEVGGLLKCSLQTVYNYIKTGKLNAVKRGGKWYITNKDIERFLEIN